MAKFNIDKAKAAGMTDEQIQAFLTSRPDLQPKNDLTGNLSEDIKSHALPILGQSIKEMAPAVRSATEKVGDFLHLPETGHTKSTAANIAIGTPRAILGTAGDLVAENVTPTALAVNAATLGAGEVAPALLKGTSKILGKTLSGKSMKTIGKLFEDPGALGAGVKESVTKGAQKAFGAAKEMVGIRQVKEGIDALESPRQAVKRLFDPELRAAFNKRASELMQAGAAQSKAMRYTAQELKIPEIALEARQAIDELPKGKIESPSIQALRKKVNTVLDNVAPEVRAADPAVSRAKLGQEFLQVLPEGFGRRLIATAGLGGSALNPALLGPTLAFSPLATGVGTAAAGAVSKGIQGLSRTALRRALVGAMASRMNPQEEGK